MVGIHCDGTNLFAKIHGGIGGGGSSTHADDFSFFSFFKAEWRQDNEFILTGYRYVYPLTSHFPPHKTNPHPPLDPKPNPHCAPSSVYSISTTKQVISLPSFPLPKLTHNSISKYTLPSPGRGTLCSPTALCVSDVGPAIS